MNICLFGGTFNPIHLGHLKMCEFILNEINIDSFYFIPSGNSYLKENVLNSNQRFEMTHIAINDYFKNNCKVKISDVELKRKGPSYSYETIEYFKNLKTNSRTENINIYFLIGEDSLYNIEKWKNPEYIFNNSTVIVLQRADSDDKLEKKSKELSLKYNSSIIPFIFNYPISSTYIRNNIYSEEFDYKNYLTDNVYRYILDNGLYKNNCE